MAPHDWNRIDDLFQAALGVAPEDRAGFIDAACADDEDTAREVRALVDAHGAAIGFLEPLGVAPGDGASTDLAPLAAGLRVGAYEVVRESGVAGWARCTWGVAPTASSPSEWRSRS